MQPHSGSQANAAAYLALINPGDPILGMSLDHGGHLTHGAKVNFSGKLFKAVQYGLDPNTGEIDYARVEQLAQEHRPRMIIAGFSAYSRVVDWERFRRIADGVGAYFVVDMAHVAGLVAAGIYPNPVPHADVVTTTTHKTLRGPRGGLILARPNDEIHKKLNSLVFPGTQGGPLMHVIAAKAVALLEALQPEFVAYQKQVLANARAMAGGLMKRGYKIVSGGTDNHLFLVDLIDKNITGKDADAALGRAHITVNKNAVPNDPRPPFVTSGLRIGTPAATTRGFKEAEVLELANWIADVLDENLQRRGGREGAGKVTEICRRFPVYGRNCMHCPFCNHEETKVIDSRLAGEGQQIRRRRECLQCGERFTTFETAELVMPRIVKNDASREPFDESKLRSSMLKALEKRPVSSEALDAAVVHICHKLRALGEREVTSRLVGELAMEELHNLDEVAYVQLRVGVSQLPGRRRVPRRDRAHAQPPQSRGGRGSAGAVDRRPTPARRR